MPAVINGASAKTMLPPEAFPAVEPTPAPKMMAFEPVSEALMSLPMVKLPAAVFRRTWPLFAVTPLTPETVPISSAPLLKKFKPEVFAARTETVLRTESKLNWAEFPNNASSRAVISPVPIWITGPPLVMVNVDPVVIGRSIVKAPRASMVTLPVPAMPNGSLIHVLKLTSPDRLRLKAELLMTGPAPKLPLSTGSDALDIKLRADVDGTCPTTKSPALIVVDPA